jgi:acyl-CoA dehydrogenase
MAAKSPFYTDEHHALRDTLRRFVDREITPHVDAWDEAEAFPRELYRKAGEVGLLGIGFPEAYGGTGGDGFHRLVVCEELARTGSGGIASGLMSHGIGAPPIVALGSAALKERLLPPILAGEKICALAITEPSGGSDVANLQTTARRDGDHYVLNGSKTFITSGMRADVITVAVRTGGPGMGGISLVVVEPRDDEAPHFQRTSLKKMGWWSSDTATLYFDDYRVPASNLLGTENMGFLGIMQNFNAERLSIAGLALGFSQVCLDEAVAWAKQRTTFGKPLVKHQVIRHKLVDMMQRIEGLRATLELLTWRVDRGEWPIAEVCLAKNQATQCMEFCAKEAVQILGGAGYIRGVKSERIYRETKVLAIGGGAEEIMKELAAKQLGWG